MLEMIVYVSKKSIPDQPNTMLPADVTVDSSATFDGVKMYTSGCMRMMKSPGEKVSPAAVRFHSMKENPNDSPLAKSSLLSNG